MAKGLRSNAKRKLRAIRREALAQSETTSTIEEKKNIAMQKILAEVKAKREVVIDWSSGFGQLAAAEDALTKAASQIQIDPEAGATSMDCDRPKSIGPQKQGMKVKGRKRLDVLAPGLNNFHPRRKKGARRYRTCK